MERRSSILFIILILLGAYLYILWHNYTNLPKERNQSIENAQKEILRIDTIIKRYDSVIYKTKIKTNEKIRIIYLLPDSLLIDSIKSRLQDFDSLGNAKNTIYHGTEQK